MILKKLNDISIRIISNIEEFGIINITSKIAKKLNGNTFSIGRWYDGIQEGEEETMNDFNGIDSDLKKVLDNYIKIRIGKRNLYEDFFIDTESSDIIQEIVYNDIACILKSNEDRLNRQYYSNLLIYNPIDNYDRTETQTHNEELNSAEKNSSSTIGKRKNTMTNGTFTDTTIDSGKASPFDSTEYSKSTTKNETSFIKGQSTDISESDSATDSNKVEAYKDTSSGGYTLRARGNIGTMTTGYMLNEFRNNALYNFFNEVIKVIEENITTMNYDL